MKTALILFAHGARDPEWAAPMRRVQARIREQLDGVPVELAFLEFMTPTLLDCAATLAEAGADKIVVVPMFIARGGHLKHELPAIMESLRARWPGVEFSLSGPVGEHETVVRAMAAAALEEAGLGIA